MFNFFCRNLVEIVLCQEVPTWMRRNSLLKELHGFSKVQITQNKWLPYTYRPALLHFSWRIQIWALFTILRMLHQALRKISSFHEKASLAGLQTFCWKSSDSERMPDGYFEQAYTGNFLKQAKSAAAISPKKLMWSKHSVFACQSLHVCQSSLFQVLMCCV